MLQKLFSRRLLALGVIASLALVFAVVAEPAYATTIVPSCARPSTVNAPPPSLACALQTFQNIARLIMGITGSAALLMFVWGGFTLLTSGGVEAKVTQGKTIIKNAVIGIILVLTAFYIVDYFVYALRGSTLHTPGSPCQNNKGIWVSVSSTTVECRTTCQSLIQEEANFLPEAQRHQCMSRDSVPTGYVCNDNVCGDGSATSQRCCAPPEPEPVAAPEE